MSYILAGALGGLGQAMVDLGEQRKREAEQRRQEARRDRLRQEERQWRKEDRADERQYREQWRDEGRAYENRQRGLAAQADTNVYRSLFGTESGGNFGAQNSEGYTGRSQFGPERLADFTRAHGVGPIDINQFKRDPALQQQVEQWHFQDINKFIDDNELTRFEGQKIGGVPITRSSIIAMAHLGGSAGAKKFLESGGRYNPKDSNGTHLSDYARTHGGLDTSMEGVWDALSDPNVSPAVRTAAVGEVARRRGLGPSDRKVIRGADGFNYYQDTGERVLPGVQRSPSDEYERYASEERAAGREPLSRVEYAQAKKGNGTSVELPDGTRMQVGGAAKFTEGQSKDNVYATRAQGALEVFEPVADLLVSRTNRAADADPTGLARELQNPDFQVARQAGEEFLQAILRKDTGAAITSQEQMLYGKTFLPQPGDQPPVLEAKRQARRRALEAIKSGMSPAQIIAQERALTNSGDRTAEPASPEPSVSVGEIAQMSIEDLTQLDIMSLSLEQLDEAERRFRELQGGQR